MDKKEFCKLIKKIPKAEIHLHCEGVISHETARCFLMREDKNYQSINKVKNLFKYNNLSEFIQTFLLIQRSYKNLSDFKKVFIDLANYLKRNGIVYSEVYLSPTQFVKSGFIYAEIIKVITEEIRKIRKKSGIVIKLIVDVSRTFGPENAMTNLESIITNLNNSIVGIGLGGDESKGPAKDYKEVFAVAKKHGLHRVAHAGEDVGPESIWDAINYLDIERIGHGITAIQDEKLMGLLADRSIPVEINMTSNLFTKYIVKDIKEHPVKPFYEKGIRITVNTDDPTFFNVELVDEYWNLYNELGFTLDDIKLVVINGFESSFMKKSTKRNYIKKVNKLFNRYIK